MPDIQVRMSFLLFCSQNQVVEFCIIYVQKHSKTQQ